MKAIKLVVLAIVTMAVTAAGAFAHEYNEAYSLEDVECFISTGTITLTVIMPAQLHDYEKELHSQSVCDSIEETSTPVLKPAPKKRVPVTEPDMIVCHDQILYPSHAVCDTDMNCEYYDEYNQYGVAEVMVSHDDEYGMRWLAVKCIGEDADSEPMIIDDPSEMGVICKETNNE